MINSHLLYRLSYRGTSVFQSQLPDQINLFPHLRRAILRFRDALSTP